MIDPARIVGVDPSLTATGLATADGTSIIAPPKGVTGAKRLAYFRDAFTDLFVDGGRPQLVVLEGYSYASQNNREVMGELGGVIRLTFHDTAVTHVVAAPSTRMQYATGKGMAPKEAVMAEAIRRLDYQGQSYDEADALWLREMALAHYAPDLAVEVPAQHRAAIYSTVKKGKRKGEPVIEWPVF